MSVWAYAHAVRQGVSPGKEGCQDFAGFEEFPLANGETVAVGVISDGAGSAKEAAEGAELACMAFLRQVGRVVATRNSLKGMGKTHAGKIIQHVHKILVLHAETMGIRPAELSCTLVGALVSDHEALFVQVGDGAIVMQRGDCYDVAIWPDQGEYVNETVFITDPKCGDRVQVNKINESLDGVVLFSDGLQYLVLDYKDMSPHTPFFRSVFKALSKQEVGKSEVVSKWIDEAVLGNPAVATKTDDDLSLVVAVRANGKD